MTTLSLPAAAIDTCERYCTEVLVSGDYRRQFFAEAFAKLRAAAVPVPGVTEEEIEAAGRAFTTAPWTGDPFIEGIRAALTEFLRGRSHP